MAKTRTLRVGSTSYVATRLYSSGLGAQYTLTSRDPQAGTEKTQFLSFDGVKGNTELSALFEACEAAFDDHYTLDKRL